MKRILTISTITVLLASLVLIPYPVRAAAEVWVDDDWDGLSIGTMVDGHTIGTDAFATIQGGIDAADQNGSVNVAAGTYNENIIISARPKIKIIGAGAAVTTINGDIDGDSVGDGSVVEGNNMHADSKIKGFTITGGVAPSPGRGGGLYLESSATTISSCNITGNSAVVGGGIYLTDEVAVGLSPKVLNCLVKNNNASSMGGGLFFFGSTLSPTIMNSTIAGNTAGDGVYNIQASTTITNTIIYGNSGVDVTNSGGTLITSNNIVGTGETGTGTDPLFVGSGDYHLQSGPPVSPGIDAGTATGAPDKDLDGVDRPQGAGVDIGAFEYLPPQTPQIDIEKHVNGFDADNPSDSDVPILTPGDAVTWTYYVVNTGTVAIPAADISVLDDQPGITPVLDPASDVGSDGILSPGESWVYTATGTVQDLAGGTYANTGTVNVPGASDTDMAHYVNPLAVNYTLSLIIVGGGTVSFDPVGPTYSSGTEVTLTANPNAGWAFTGWSDDLSGSANPATITMDGNKSVTANFAEDLPPVESAYDIKSDTVGKLESAKGEDRKINRKIDRIIGLINASLNDKYWEDNISRLDARLGKKVFQKELAAAVSLETQLKTLSKQISALERKIERKENKGRPTDAEEAKLAAIHNTLPAFQEVLEDLTQADKVLAEVALGDARDMTVNNPKFEKAYNRYLDSAEQQMNKAMAALEDGKSAKAIKYFKNAWYYAQKAIRYAGRV